MKILLLSFFLVFSTTQLFPQQQNVSVLISGKVITADGLPASGLLISIKDSKSISYTQNDGTFKILSPIGKIQLVVKSAISSLEENVEITAAQNQSLAIIQLKEKLYELKEVVVTAQYEPQSLKNSVYNVRTISAEKIRLRAATNVQQILNTELGFRFTNDLTLGIADVQVMGMSGRNIKILLDGVPMVDRSDSRESLNQIDINTVERIEIVEGPVSVVYGTDALAGVINIITKTGGKALLNVAARIQEETAGNEYGAINGGGIHNKNISANWTKNGWNILVGATHNDFSGWNLPSKTATLAEVAAATNSWKPKEQLLGNAKIGYRNNNFNIWYRLDALKETIDSRGGMNPTIFVAKLQTYTTNRYTQQLQSEYRFSEKLQLNGIVGFTNLERGTRTVKHDFTNSTEELSTDAGEQDVAKFNATIVRATAQYLANKTISIQPGFEFNRDAASANRIKGSPIINDYALFVSSEIKPTKNINIRPGLRFIKNSVFDAPPVIPSLNTKFGLSKNLDLRLAYARGFRSPALRELYYNFIDASHTIIGNPDLKAEESNSFNGSIAWAGIKKENLQFRTTLAGFYNDFHNRIGFDISPTDNTVTTLLNISKFKTTGSIIENVLIYRNFQAIVGVSYIGTYHDLSEGEDLDVPSFVWSPEVSTNLSYTFSKAGANISLYYKYAGSRSNYQQVTVAGVQTSKLVKIGGFNWADLMINKNLLKYITINAGVKNLFNITQLTNSSVASGGAHSSGGGTVPYSYGRSYVLGLSFNWNKN